MGLVKLHLLLVHYSLDLRVFSSDNLKQIIGQYFCTCNLTLLWPAGTEVRSTQESRGKTHVI